MTAIRSALRISVRWILPYSSKRVWIGAGALATFQFPESVHLVRAQLEVEQPEVLIDPRRCRGLRDHDGAELDVPAQHDLGGGAVVRRGDPFDHRIVEQLTFAERAP